MDRFIIKLMLVCALVGCIDAGERSIAGFYSACGFSPAAWPTPDPALESMVFPSRFDLRETGGATPAKNQGFSSTCFPCWSFSLIGAAESAIRLSTGIEYDLSEQQLLDCNVNGYGCDGGFINGWTALRDYGAVPEICYPFMNTDTDCNQSRCEPVGWITGVYPVPYSIHSLKYALLHHGALSCSMTIYNDIMSYSGGCYFNDGTRPVNHGVVLLGWDDAACDGTGAWIVKNSWGPDWGEDGAVWMRYGTCNIGKHAQWFECATQQPPQQLHYSLGMPDMIMQSGDWFVLERRIGNPLPRTIDCLEFILLDIEGSYWFYPTFSQEPDWEERSIASEYYRCDIMLAFVWPETDSAPDSFCFWGACFDASTKDALGWDRIECSVSGMAP